MACVSFLLSADTDVASPGLTLEQSAELFVSGFAVPSSLPARDDGANFPLPWTRVGGGILNAAHLGWLPWLSFPFSW